MARNSVSLQDVAREAGVSPQTVSRVANGSVAVKVRDRKITDIVPTSEYSYGGVPVVNGRALEWMDRSHRHP